MKPRLFMVVNDPHFFLSHRLPVALAARAEYEVHIATGPGEAIDAIKHLGFQHHLLPLERSSTGLVSEWRLLRHLWKLYRLWTPAICHHVTIKPVIYGSLAAKFAGNIAVVNAIPGLGFIYTGTSFKHRMLKTVVSTLYKLALSGQRSFTIFQNPDNFNYFRHQRLINSDHAILIKGSGIDLNEFAYTPPQDLRPLMVILPARMLWDKGVREFVEASRRCKSEGKSIVFQLVGDTDPGNPSAIPSAQLQAWQQEGIVEWVGYQSSILPYFQRADIVCLPSYLEGLPKSLIEACAVGRPIITTDVPGCRETVEEGLNGLLVPARDSEALALAIMELAEDTQRRLDLGLASRKKAEQEFSIKTVVDQHLALYQRALSAQN